MIARFRARVGLLLLSGSLILALCPPRAVARQADSQAAQADVSTNAIHHVSPGLIDGRVGYVTAKMLEGSHYSKKPFDGAVSSKFLDLYLEALDQRHIHFTQADLADFEQYRTNLNHLTVPEGGVVGDTRPACEIFNRFFERLSQRTAYVEAMLKNEKFTFDTDERIALNRKGMPYPKDLDEAQQLWREQVRYEYLQELLGKIGSRKKATTLAKKTSASEPAPAPPPSVAAPDIAASVSAPMPENPPHRPVLHSPKGGEQAITRSVAAAWRHDDTICCPALPEKAIAQAPSPAPQDTVPSAAAQATNAPAKAATKKSDHEEIVETLMHRYHRNLRFFEDWNNEDVLQAYLSALAHVYDPHSDYLGHAQLDQFAMTMNLSLFGIGAELMLSEDGYCTIRRLLAGGPAIKSKKIKENDRIVAVAQGDQPPVDVIDMSLNKAVQLIRGPKGTEVRLTIIPAGAENSARSVVSIIRDEIPLEESAAKAKIIDLPDGRGGQMRLGLIDLPSFYATFDVTASKDKPEPKSTTADVARLLRKLEHENVSGVVLDLRHNGGGSLEEAIKLTGLFIKTGPVVQVRQADGKVEELRDNDPAVLYEGPLLVMTSLGSASASEIVAGALQDYGRALIVGDISTHGKGTVQSVNALAPLMGLRRSVTNDPGALKLTIKKFYRPSGASTQLKGVVPDIVLPSLANESKDAGEKGLDNAMPGDSILSATFDHFNLVEPYLAELRKRSSDRVANNKEYAYVRDDIERYLKQQADKTISLNESVRLKENEENEVRTKMRDKERLARHQASEKVYELTLKLADQPGLPPAVGSINAPIASLGSLPATAPAAAGTNSLASAGKTMERSLDEVEEPKAPVIDAPLQEAEQILVDYLSLLPKGSLVTADH
jgi:carboxyl-terminal processing protease